MPAVLCAGCSASQSAAGLTSGRVAGLTGLRSRGRPAGQGGRPAPGDDARRPDPQSRRSPHRNVEPLSGSSSITTRDRASRAFAESTLHQRSAGFGSAPPGDEDEAGSQEQECRSDQPLLGEQPPGEGDSRARGGRVRARRRGAGRGRGRRRRRRRCGRRRGHRDASRDIGDGVIRIRGAAAGRRIRSRRARVGRRRRAGGLRGQRSRRLAVLEPRELRCDRGGRPALGERAARRRDGQRSCLNNGRTRRIGDDVGRVRGAGARVGTGVRANRRGGGHRRDARGRSRQRGSEGGRVDRRDDRRAAAVGGRGG